MERKKTRAVVATRMNGRYPNPARVRHHRGTDPPYARRSLTSMLEVAGKRTRGESERKRDERRESERERGREMESKKTRGRERELERASERARERERERGSEFVCEVRKDKPNGTV